MNSMWNSLLSFELEGLLKGFGIPHHKVAFIFGTIVHKGHHVTIIFINGVIFWVEEYFA